MTVYTGPLRCRLGPLYSSAFRCERRQRIAEAIAAWREIVERSRERGNLLDAEWPLREIERLELVLRSR